MDYVSILDPVPWPEIGITVLQTAVIFTLLLVGLKLVGRRVFAQLGPQELILLLLIAEACDIGLTPEGAGFWGTVASAITLLFLVGVSERIPPLRRIIDNEPVVLIRDGQIAVDLKKYMISEDDLDGVARQYGLASYKDFQSAVLEDDGNITAVLSIPRPSMMMVK